VRVSAARGPIGLHSFAEQYPHITEILLRPFAEQYPHIAAKFGRIVSRIIRKDYCAHPAG